MGGKYYCDYCDITFSDDGNKRNKHLESIGHRSSRKAHYDLYRDAATILREDEAKQKCKRFGYGQCPFRENCRHSHLTDSDIQRLKAQAHLDEQRKNGNATEPISEDSKSVGEAMFADWIDKRFNSGGELRLADDYSTTAITTVPDNLNFNMQSFPPSLLPPR